VEDENQPFTRVEVLKYVLVMKDPLPCNVERAPSPAALCWCAFPQPCSTQSHW